MILCIEREGERLVISFQDADGFHQLSSHASPKQVRKNGKVPGRRKNKIVDVEAEQNDELTPKLRTMANNLLAGQSRLKITVEGSAAAEDLLAECVKVGMKSKK